MSQQSAKPDFQKWTKWREHLGTVEQELLRLDHSRKIFLKVWGVIQQNSDLKKHLNDIYLQWLVHNYCVKIGIGIRRLVEQCERHKKSVSLFKVLNDIEKNIHQVNVENLTDFFMLKKQNPSDGCREHYHTLALENYEKAFGVRKENLSLEDVQRDIQQIVKATKKIKEYVDKNWAHTDKDKNKFKPPHLAHAHHCLDMLIKIFSRYSILVGEHEFDSYPECFFADWDKPLRVAWVKKTKKHKK